MKALINTKVFKLFRKSFLERIRQNIFATKENYCCAVFSWHRFFICWKNLKEVKENMHSKFLIERENYDCKGVWFINRHDRINFLTECLLKFENNEK